jgi:hypothetical protein
MLLRVFLISLFFPLACLAEEAGVAEKARLRLYDGGMDEQPLQVQANLYNPKTEIEKTGEGENAPTNITAPAAVDEAPQGE